MLHKCFFCGEQSLIPGEQFCTYCGADIEKTKLDVVILFLAPYIDLSRREKHILDFPEIYRNRLKEEAKLYFPIIEILNADQDNLRHKISSTLRDEIRAKTDNFGQFIDDFRSKNSMYIMG
ncbi:hypothetical protein CH370_14590 [Leptospira kmetyi]|nr:hypothetical protein CH370_14590 [Leptospira kmetyi]